MNFPPVPYVLRKFCYKLHKKANSGATTIRAFPFGISRQICFFYEVGLSDQCPQPRLHEEKPLTYPGFEPLTFGFQVGNATN
jgi:hypothetical protein